METNQKLKLQKKYFLISVLLTKMKIILFLSILVKELKCMTIWWKCTHVYMCTYIYTSLFNFLNNPERKFHILEE